MKERLIKILRRFFALKVKLRKAANENAIWTYVPTSQYPILVSEDDFTQTDEYLEQYLRCVLGFQFDHNVLLEAGA